MNADDFAIVVGIRDYPNFGTTSSDPRNLQGPDNDATAVHRWLVDPEKGGVPAANATLIRTSDFSAAPGGPAQPQKQAIIDAFNVLEDRAQQNDQAGNGLRVGRRLYMYMSGHGFAPRRKEGAVFAADATRSRTHHIFATRWLEWFYNADYFDEFVLLMDCCMVFDLTVVPESPGFRLLQGTGSGALFSAYAARFPQQAVERQMPDGKVHGVFTWALLEGLNGAAASPITRQVTSESLKNYLIHQMKAFMDPMDIEDSNVSKEPDFGADDPIVFCTVETVPQAVVHLLFPLALADQDFTVVSGTPPKTVAHGRINGRLGKVNLPPGIYFVKAPGLAKGFEVEGTQEFQIDV